MADRKKQPKRGARKPNANRKRRTKAPKVLPDLVPHKIEGQLIGKIVNEKGEQVGEQPIGPVQIFSANFGRVKELVDDSLREAKAVEKARREAMEEAGE